MRAEEREAMKTFLNRKRKRKRRLHGSAGTCHPLAAFRYSVLEAEKLEKKRREEMEKELADINRGREDDGYIPGVCEPECGH
jgi:hypothetical protein